MPDLARLTLDTDPYSRDQLAAMTRELSRLAGLKLATDLAFLDQLRETLTAQPVDGARLGREITAWAETFCALRERTTDTLARIAAETAGGAHH